MVREVAISIYLALFRLVFTICKMFPQKEKTVCVSSFGDNIHYSTQSLRSISDQDIIYLKDRSCTYPFDTSIGTVIPFTMMHPIAYIRSIYHLATATTILTDNYFGFFAAAPFKSGTLCIQLWHAVGSLKQFGLNDPAIAKRSDKAIERFRQVYDTFDYVIVGSEKMGTIFRENFGLSHERLRRTGIPRTDLFYDENAMNRMRQDMIDRYPETRGKKVILYAPTFRRNGSQTNALDTEKLYQAFGDDYVLFIKQHPSVHHPIESEHPDFVYDVSDYHDINHLLLITDVLISDYSSVPFEFALLHRPIIFFTYDIEAYDEKQGVSHAFDEQMPGPMVYTTDEVITTIQNQDFQLHDINDFADKWNLYSKGQSSMNVAELIDKHEQPALSEQVN